MGHRPPAAPSAMPHQEAPFCLQIELTLGCNLQCHFCGLNGVQEKPNSNNRFMTVETACLVAQRIADSGWNTRLEFARRGEPTLNPWMHDIIHAFRQRNPKLQIQMTANGGGLPAGSVTFAVRIGSEVMGSMSGRCSPTVMV